MGNARRRGRNRRLDDPDDYVRFEVQAALERGLRVVPVLVDGARPLRQQQLPPGLHKLARLNAIELSYGRYHYDADRLLDLVQRVLDAAADTGAADRSAPFSAAGSPATPTVARAHQVRPEENAAGEPAKEDPGPVRNDRARVLSEAEHVARSITDGSVMASSLVSVASALATTDPDRADRLIADAEHAARSITAEDSKDFALSDVAMTVAATHPECTERIARSINVPVAVRNVAVALAATDPDRAERVARSTTDERDLASALLAVAESLAAAQPNTAARFIADAEQIARSNADEFLQEHALAEVAKALAATDPDRAERVARSITDKDWRGMALAEIVEVLAATDPDRAVRLIADVVRAVRSMTHDGLKAHALADVAKALAATEPDRAERIAQSITERGAKVLALVGIAVRPDR